MPITTAFAEHSCAVGDPVRGQRVSGDGTAVNGSVGWTSRGGGRMDKRWYACEKCQEVDSYYLLDDKMTTFPRGELLAHRDYLVTGFKTEDEARTWLTQHPATVEG